MELRTVAECVDVGYCSCSFTFLHSHLCINEYDAVDVLFFCHAIIV